MSSTISIIYANTNSATEEKIAIGIIYLSNDEAKLLTAHKKISLSKLFLSHEESNFLENNLNLIQNKINEINKSIENDKENSKSISKEYFNYLNKYNSQGILLFSKPKPINTSIGKMKINNLLIKLLNVEEDIDNDISILKSKYLIIEPKTLKGLLKPIKFIKGYYNKKSVELFKEFDFNKKDYFIISEFYELEFFKELLSKKINFKEEDIKINLLLNSDIKNSSYELLNEILSAKDYKVYFNKESINKDVQNIINLNYKDLRELI